MTSGARRLDPIEFRPSRLRMVGYLLGSLAFVAASARILQKEDVDLVTRLAARVGIPFFGLGVVLFVAEMIRPRIRIRLDENGIDSRHTLTASRYLLPWSEIEGIRVEATMGQPLILLDVHDSDWGIRRPNAATYGLRRANEFVAGSGFALAPKVFGVKTDLLVEEIERRLRVYRDSPTRHQP